MVLHWRQLLLMKIEQTMLLEILRKFIILINLNMIEALIPHLSSIKIGNKIMIKEITILVLPMPQDFKPIISLFQMLGKELRQSTNQSILTAQISNQLLLLLQAEVEFLWHTWLLILRSTPQDSSRIFSKRVSLLLFKPWTEDSAEAILNSELHQLKIKESA